MRLERGDTIIEVIFAIVIFSFVAIASLAIMNKGLAVGEKALEITLVRQQINAQAEALRFIHEARVVTPASDYGTTWSEMIANYGQESASAYGVDGSTCVLPAGNPFILNARTAEVWGAPTIAYEGTDTTPPYPQVVYDKETPTVVNAAYGMWIEAVPSDLPVERQFVDFHIRACWPAPGSSVPMTIGTIVRLYDPAA